MFVAADVVAEPEAVPGTSLVEDRAGGPDPAPRGLGGGDGSSDGVAGGGLGVAPGRLGEKASSSYELEVAEPFAATASTRTAVE